MVWDEKETIDQEPIDVPPLRQSPESKWQKYKKQGWKYFILILPVLLVKRDKVKARDVVEAILRGD